MNEEAIKDSYNVFVSQGYTKSIDEYKKLIATNPEALKDSYNAFVSQGYGKSIDDYKSLMGVSTQPAQVKKKDIGVSNVPTPKQSTTALPSAPTSSVTQPSKEDEEEDYFKGTFGSILRGFDDIVPLGIGDFVDDMSRSVAAGYRQGQTAKAADKLLMKGSKATPEQIQKFIDAKKNSEQLTASNEFLDYQKTYEKEGKGFWGVVKGLASNPSVFPEVMLSSLTSMATNTDALKAAALALGTGASIGAATGAGAGTAALPVAGTAGGGVAGAISGAGTAVPFAFGLASTVVETGSTFGELLTEELNGAELTKENVKKILENPEKYKSIRNKAIARGLVIGAVDAFTGKLASGVGAKIIGKSAAKSATGVATKQAIVKATGAGAAIEAAGGSTGEAAARATIGQEMDISEIALEGLADLPGGVRSTIQARFAKPSYEVNGDKVSAEDVDDLINTMTPEQLAVTDIKIKNDYQGREFKIQDKIVTNTVKEQVRQANPSLNEPSLNAITQLEKELQTLEGNKTQTGKDKASALRNKIKDIQENQLEEEATVQTAEALEAPDEIAARTERISELENTLSPEAETQVPAAEKVELEKELETLKKEEDAVQIKSTAEIPVQSEAGISETLEEGKPESRPEVVTEQVTQEEVAPTEIIKVKKSPDFMNDAEHIVTVNDEEAGRMYYDRSSKAWRDPNFDKSKYSPESFERVYGDILGDTKQEATDELIKRRKESMKKEAPVEEVSTEKPVVEESQEVKFSNDTILNKFLNKLNSLNPLQKNPIDNKSFIYGDKASLEFNRFNKGDKNEVSLEGIVSLDKGKGLGKEAMADITKSADELGTILTLDAKPFGKEGLGKKELIDFYKKNGFEIDKQYLENLDFASEQEAIDYVLENESEALPMVRTPKPPKVKAEATPVEKAIQTLQESKEYAEADDTQKENLVRATRKKFGLREKAAPSPLKSDITFGIGRVISSIKDFKKVTMTEKAALAKQLRDKARGARESIQAWKKQTEELIEVINGLEKSGKITVKQSTAIINKFSKINIFSEKSIGRFTDYIVKVFNDANYKDKLATARKTLSSLKKLSKNETKNANLRAVSSEFVKIDPSLVDNIDEYNENANNIKEAVEGSKIRKADTKFAETINIEDALSYIDKTLAEQESKLKEEKIKEIQDLFGVDASEFNAEEIDALLESDKDLSKDDEKIVRASIKKAFDIYSSVIKQMLKTGIDPFTDEEVSFDDKQKDIIERFMNIDPNKIKDPKEALRTVDSLINFVQNKSTAGMLKPIADYEGILGGEKAVDQGLKAIGLRKYWSPKLGLLFGQKTTTLPVLFEKMFKGVKRALKVEELIGTSDLINNSSKAESESNKIVKGYVKQFYDKQANGEAFNSAYNDIERGVLAHVLRNVIGPESRMKKVFDKRKQEVLDSIKLLSKEGNESEIETAKLLQKVYDKILDGSENAQDVRNKTDINNVNAVSYWTNQWANKYEDLSDLALNFYNKVLGRDLNFTPDRIRKLQDKVEDIDLEDIQSQFFVNTDDILYDKKSGSLMDKQEDRRIPKDMYVDFSFDKKNSNAMNDALTDLYTAFDIRKVGSFLKSESFRKIFPSVKDANIVDKRIKKFVRLTRKKTPFSNDEISDFLKKADKLAKFGVTASLASPAQPFKQTIPVMFSTAMNAGSVGMKAAFNPKFNDWLNDLGYAISNRGVESQSEINSLNNLIEKAADMPLDKALKFLEKTNDKALKALLVNFDVWIARASFKAYYEQSLKQQGEQYSNIDYSKHKTNKEAANYAQRMVDRQQNISNQSLAGDLFTSDSKSSKVFIKMLMPFSSFRMNQASRIASDLSTLEYWNTSTKEDKVIALRSIAGYALESLTYRSLQIGFSLLMYSIAKSIMGKEDDEEDEKFKDNLIKGSASSAFLDTFSPIPLGDPFLQDAMAYGADEVQSLMDIPEEEKLKLFQSQEQSALKMLGTYGIPLEKAKDIFSLGKLAYTQKYKDDYGKEQTIPDYEADRLKLLVAPLFAASVMGVGSPDISSIVRKSIKIAKKSEQSKENKIKRIKESNPKLYERLYGEGTKYYKLKEREKEIKSKLEERKKEREDRIKKKMKRD